MADAPPLRLDELAREAGIPTTTVRLYQNKGLLHGPRLVGRTGFYDDTHLARLALIGRLQEQGFSLAAIGQLLETWESGGDLADLVGVEQQLDQLLAGRRAVELDPGELMASFPPGSITPDHIQRAAALGLVEAIEDGRVRVLDKRFLDTGTTLVALGVPTDVVLDEWEHLSGVTDELAARFIAVFEDHLLPPGWFHGLDPEEAEGLAGTLAQLQATSRHVVMAALDASIARQGSRRIAELLGTEPDPGA